jgi:hypothetical protein
MRGATERCRPHRSVSCDGYGGADRKTLVYVDASPPDSRSGAISRKIRVIDICDNRGTLGSLASKIIISPTVIILFPTNYSDLCRCNDVVYCCSTISLVRTCQESRPKHYPQGILAICSCTRAARATRIATPCSCCSRPRRAFRPEIANLTWDMVVDAAGQVGGIIELRNQAEEMQRPDNPDLAAALAAWRSVAPKSDYVLSSERGGRMRPLRIVTWFNRAFKNIGLKGCSSHSGRRTFVTKAARLVHKAGGSLDVSASTEQRIKSQPWWQVRGLESRDPKAFGS